MIYEELTRKSIGCVMRVHPELRSEFLEVIYHHALEIELRHNNIAFVSEKEMNIFYRNELVGKRRVDIFIENQIMVEIKAITKLEDVHLAQAMNYLEASKLPIGLLFNFGAISLEFKRVHNNKIIS
ncbi:MAG: GxxExxY protein [Chitinophagaceae bacterium]